MLIDIDPGVSFTPPVKKPEPPPDLSNILPSVFDAPVTPPPAPKPAPKAESAIGGIPKEAPVNAAPGSEIGPGGDIGLGVPAPPPPSTASPAPAPTPTTTPVPATIPASTTTEEPNKKKGGLFGISLPNPVSLATNAFDATRDGVSKGADLVQDSAVTAVDSTVNAAVTGYKATQDGITFVKESGTGFFNHIDNRIQEYMENLKNAYRPVPSNNNPNQIGVIPPALQRQANIAQAYSDPVIDQFMFWVGDDIATLTTRRDETSTLDKGLAAFSLATLGIGGIGPDDLLTKGILRGAPAVLNKTGKVQDTATIATKSASAWPTPDPQLFVKSVDEVTVLQRHIDEGLQLIRAGEYDAAINHFRNAEVAQQAGFSFSNDAAMLSLNRAPSNTSEVTEYANIVAQNSWFKANGTIQPSDAILYDFTSNTPLHFATMSAEQQALVNALRHDIALVHAEEWIHAYQHATGKPLLFTGPDALASPADEVDVALFLRQQGIELTENFLNRYQRSDFVR